MKIRTLIFSAFALCLATFPTSARASAGNPVLDPEAMDTTVDPCQDFYQYACGNWLRSTPLPSDQSSWARSFSVVYEQNLKTLNEVLTDYSKGNFTPSTPYAKKLGDFYSSCMDESQVEKRSKAALAAALSELDALSDKKDLAAAVARMHLEGAGALFSFTASADLKNPSLEIAEIDQGGMGLPDGTYYTKTDAASVTLRQAYQDHLARMLVLAGMAEPAARDASARILGLESELASSALPPESLQDPTVLYHPGDVTAVAAQAPDFDWNLYFRTLGIAVPRLIDVTEPRFMSAMSGLVKKNDLATLKLYLKSRLIEEMAPSLGQAFYSEWFNFAGKILSGQQSPPPLWRRCVKSVSSGMGEALGQAFVAKSFSPQAKARALEMIGNLQQAFEQDLKRLPWLDSSTRQAALAKLALFTRKIGYPDQWRNYDALEIGRDSLWDNVRRSAVFESSRVFHKIGGPVDPAEWGMTPQTVNAYYDPSVNQINFPAGILQPPFFSEEADDASNFGAIGMVIGHEMTHGFDTTGSKFDGHGAENDWWTPGVKKLFEQKAQCLKDQYSGYEALPGLHVNGNLTITENIADQGGLKLAFAALKLATAGKPTPPPVAGLGPEQRFFVAMGQLWCEKQSDEALKLQVGGDAHSPARFRVIGTVVNSPDFAAAFSCASGTPMAPVNRCDIW